MERSLGGQAVDSASRSICLGDLLLLDPRAIMSFQNHMQRLLHGIVFCCSRLLSLIPLPPFLRLHSCRH